MGVFNSIIDPIKKMGKELDPMAQLFPELGDFAHDTLPKEADRAVSKVTEPMDKLERYVNPFRNEDSPLYIKGLDEFQSDVAEQPVTAMGAAIGAFFGGAALMGAGGAGAGGAAGAGEVGAGVWGAGNGVAAAAPSASLAAGETATVGAGTAGGGGLLGSLGTGMNYANQGMSVYQNANNLMNPPVQQQQIQRGSARARSASAGMPAPYTLRGGLLS